MGFEIRGAAFPVMPVFEDQGSFEVAKANKPKSTKPAPKAAPKKEPKKELKEFHYTTFLFWGNSYSLGIFEPKPILVDNNTVAIGSGMGQVRLNGEMKKDGTFELKTDFRHATYKLPRPMSAADAAQIFLYSPTGRFVINQAVKGSDAKKMKGMVKEIEFGASLPGNYEVWLGKSKIDVVTLGH